MAVESKGPFQPTDRLHVVGFAVDSKTKIVKFPISPLNGSALSFTGALEVSGANMNSLRALHIFNSSQVGGGTTLTGTGSIFIRTEKGLGNSTLTAQPNEGIQIFPSGSLLLQWHNDSEERLVYQSDGHAFYALCYF